MQEQIKALRVSIDGLAQLTRNLKPMPGKFIINFDKIPKSQNIDFDTWMKYFNEMGLCFVQNSIGDDVKYLDEPSKEIDKAVDSLYLAKAWLGKVLGKLGTESPYKSGYKTKEDIEPTADVANELVFYKTKEGKLKCKWLDNNNEEINHIEKVDWLRTEIEKVIKNLPDHEEYIKDKFDEIDFAISKKAKNGTLTDSEEEDLWRQVPDVEFEMKLVYKYLSEARFWLGFELERIKNEK